MAGHFGLHSHQLGHLFDEPAFDAGQLYDLVDADALLQRQVHQVLPLAARLA